jgi:hypothetical protein
VYTIAGAKSEDLIVPGDRWRLTFGDPGFTYWLLALWPISFQARVNQMFQTMASKTQFAPVSLVATPDGATSYVQDAEVKPSAPSMSVASALNDITELIGGLELTKAERYGAAQNAATSAAGRAAAAADEAKRQAAEQHWYDKVLNTLGNVGTGLVIVAAAVALIVVVPRLLPRKD